MNRRLPQIPQIGRGPSQFAMDNRPPMMSPMAMGQPPQQHVSAEAAVMAAVSEDVKDMAMEIYCRLAVSHLTKNGMPADVDLLRQMATEAQTAAKAYFESLGVHFDG